MPQVAIAVPIQAGDMSRDALPVAIVYGAGGDFSPLDGANNIRFQQGNVFWEMVTGGCANNTYKISDNDRGYAIFLGEEESNCWHRCCYRPAQPAFVKFYNAQYAGASPEVKKCGITCMRSRKQYTRVGAPVMTLEKPGLCSNFAQLGPLNCFVCMACCQSETWIHKGDIPTTAAHREMCCGPCRSRRSMINSWEYAPGAEPGMHGGKPSVMAHAKVPLRGGGFTPTIQIFENNGGVEDVAPFATITGPTFFGGCKDLFCDTLFNVTSQGSEVVGDIGTITKLKPTGGAAMLTQLCTPCDEYILSFNPDNKLTANQRAVILCELAHIDFLFFEKEQPLCREDSNGTIHILLCTAYVFGCLCPVEICIPKSEN